LIKNLTIYLFGGLALKLGSLVLLPIFTRNLDPSEYGAMELLNRGTEILVICLFLNGICLAAISFYNQARDDQARQRVVGSVLVFGFFFVGILGLVAQTLVQPLSVLIGVNNPNLVRLAILAAMADGLLSICLSLTQARIEAARFMGFAIAALLLRIGLITVFVSLLGWGVRGILSASLITSGSLGLIVVVLEIKRYGIHWSGATIAGMAWFALPFLPGGLCGFLLGTGDQFILAQYAVTAEIGLYALGYKLAMMVTVLSRDPLMKVWGAEMHRAALRPNASCVFGQVFTAFAAAHLFVGLALALFGPEIISVLGHSKYRAAADYIPPIVLAYFFLGASDFMDAAFYVHRRTDLKLWINVASAVATLILYLAFIPSHGAIGAAYATLGGFVFRAILTYAISQQIFRVAYEWNRVAIMLVSALGCWSLAHFLVGPLWLTIPTKITLLSLIPGLCWVTGLVRPAEKAAVVARLDRIRQSIERRLGLVSAAIPDGGAVHPLFRELDFPEPALASSNDMVDVGSPRNEQ
jgi:O-antigen/teichoic acid export membrane protein